MSYLFTGQSFSLQNAGETWSFQETDSGGDQTLRFEVRPGDHWRAADGTKERSEASSAIKLNFDQTYTLSYQMRVEGGAANAEDNVKIGQLHGTPDAGDSSNLGPVFALQLQGEHLRIVVRSDDAATTTSRVADNFIYTDPSDILRDHWYDMKLVFKLDPAGAGLLQVWRDGVEIADYHGPLGYNDAVGPYWKEGVYRATGAVALAVDFKDATLATGSAPTAPTDHGSAPSGPPVTTPTSDDPTPASPTDSGQGSQAPSNLPQHTLLGGVGADVLSPGGHNDTIYSDGLSGTGGGNDVIDAGKGNDTVLAGAGDDKVQGGPGADVLHGEAGDDVLDGGTGSDQLYGGDGADIFVFGADSGKDVILDFSASEHDRLQFTSGAFATFQDVKAHMAQVGADVVITIDANDQVTLVNTTVSALTADHFLFG